MVIKAHTNFLKVQAKLQVVFSEACCPRLNKLSCPHVVSSAEMCTWKWCIQQTAHLYRPQGLLIATFITAAHLQASVSHESMTTKRTGANLQAATCSNRRQGWMWMLWLNKHTPVSAQDKHMHVHVHTHTHIHAHTHMCAHKHTHTASIFVRTS